MSISIVLRQVRNGWLVQHGDPYLQGAVVEMSAAESKDALLLIVAQWCDGRDGLAVVKKPESVSELVDSNMFTV